MYRLTNEGRRYLENGLPEVNLLLYLEENGPTNVKHVDKELKDTDIAVSWAKKNGWIEMEGGKLHPAERPGRYELEEALRRLREGDVPEDGLLEKLERRNLVEEIKEDIQERAEKMKGEQITHLTEDLIKTGVWREVELKPYNVEATGRPLYPGRRQFYSDFLHSISRKLVEMGFKEYRGPLVELEFWNFDALFQPQDHPARTDLQTYILSNPDRGDLPDDVADAIRETHEEGVGDSDGWGYEWDEEKAAQVIARTHDTAATPRLLSEDLDIPGKYFNMGRCYRHDVIDATHGVEFVQMGGIALGEDMNLRHLLGLLEDFAEEVAGTEEVKFRPGYFPFTEPSISVFGRSEELGWMEIAGAGIFREELTQPLGIDVPVIAWGMGVDRLAMIKHDVKDIRYLFARDLEYLRNRSVR